MQQIQALQFPRGRYYQIINKANNQALRIQQTDLTKANKSRVNSSPINVNDKAQIFMIQKVGQENDQFQFVNCLSNLVFDEQSKQIRLKVGKQSSDQLFGLVKATNAPGYYWITTDSKAKKALQLQGILRYADLDQNKDSQLFKFVQIKNNPQVLNSGILINKTSGKSLDVPSSSLKPGQKIIQWDSNRRFNQRWRFEKHSNGSWFIYSLFNNLCLDIAGQAKTPNSKIAQWHNTGGLNQRWFAQPAGNGLYKFRSAHCDLYLGIKNNEINNGGQLVICNANQQSIVWQLKEFKL